MGWTDILVKIHIHQIPLPMFDYKFITIEDREEIIEERMKSKMGIQFLSKIEQFSP